MNVLLTASAVFTLVALYFLFSMLRHARRRRPVRATGSLAGGVASGAVGGASILLAFSYYGYGRHRRLQAAQADADVPLNA